MGSEMCIRDRLHGEQANNGFPARIHSLFDQVPQALVEQLPTLLGELFRLAARKKLVEHGVEPICHGTHKADQGFGVHRVELVPPGGAPKGVMAAPFPELNPVGELRLEAQLLAVQTIASAPLRSSASMVSSSRSRRSTPRRLRRAPSVGALGA